MKNVKKNKASAKEFNSADLIVRKRSANAIKVLCFVLAMILVGVAAFYFAFIWDLKEFVFIDGTEKGTVIITDYIGSDLDVKVPNTLRGKKVIAIDNQAFKGDAITSVVIGKNVKTIGENAFQGCTSLKSVDLGKSVETVGSMAFSDCTSLSEVKFSPAVKELGHMIFRNDVKLTTIDINGNTNFKFADGAIYSADMTVLYETLISADFSDYVLPKSVIEFRTMAFYGQEELTSIKLNPGTKSIPDGCFSMCKGLKELTIPDGVESVCGLIIVGSEITVINVPKSVKNINDYAFEHNEIEVLDENGSPVLDENGKPTKKPEFDIEIVTVEGSFAATFARRHEYALKIVE